MTGCLRSSYLLYDCVCLHICTEGQSRAGQGSIERKYANAKCGERVHLSEWGLSAEYRTVRK